VLFGYFTAPAGNWDLQGEPYTVAPGSQFRWWRARTIGGRTNYYGRTSLRFSDYDCKPYSFDGLGVDWPVPHEEMSPYYDKAEEFIGVTGTKQGLHNRSGQKVPAHCAARARELIQKACQKPNIPCILSRMAMLTRPVHGRAACRYCGQCGRGCQTAFGSSQAMILPTFGIRLSADSSGMRRMRMRPIPALSS
jgi:choline dehydrogenase-like flavoprotein